MSGLIRRNIVFSEHASVSLFECLIVAGAPATGLLHDMGFKDGDAFQVTLQLLRDMWQRADTLYVPRADLESLYLMECSSTGRLESRFPDHIGIEARKLSRYYIYLLYRYCMSSAGPTRCQGGSSRMCLLEPKAQTLMDVPQSWLETKVCIKFPSVLPIPDGNFASELPLSHQPHQPPPPRGREHRTNYPSAPPIPEGNFVSGFPLPHHCQPPQSKPPLLPQGREYGEMDYTKRDQLLYRDLTGLKRSGQSNMKPSMGQAKPRTKSSSRKGYDSNIDSEED